MKTFINIVRSILTSLLFLIISAAIIVQFAFTIVHMQNKKIPDLIDREVVLGLATKDGFITNNEAIRNLAIEYIDQYINYVFYKRSYPAMPNLNIEGIDENTKREITSEFDSLKEKIDLDYELVLKIRDVNNILSNGAIYLLINIGVFSLFIVMSILRGSFLKGIKYFSASLALMSLILLLAGSFAHSLISEIDNEILHSIMSEIVDGEFMNTFFNVDLIYLVTGVFSFLAIFAYERFKKN